jgi:hypothetical protein
MRNIGKALLATTMIMGLAACGGGGDSSAPSTGQAPVTSTSLELSTSVNTIEVPEMDQATIDLTFKGVKGTAAVSLDYEGTGDIITIGATNITNTGGKITVEVPELSYESTYNFTVTLSDSDNRSVKRRVTVLLVNTSAEDKIAEFRQFHSSLDTFIPLNVEQNLLQRASELVALSGGDNTVISSAGFNVLVSEQTSNILKERVAEYEDIVADYEAGALSEDVFASYTETTKIEIATHVEKVNQALEVLIEQSNGILPAIPLGETSYSGAYGMLSQFVGNEHLGSYQAETGVWTFNDNYAFLESIALPNNETCDVE